MKFDYILFISLLLVVFTNTVMILYRYVFYIEQKHLTKRQKFKKYIKFIYRKNRTVVINILFFVILYNTFNFLK